MTCELYSAPAETETSANVELGEEVEEGQRLGEVGPQAGAVAAEGVVVAALPPTPPGPGTVVVAVDERHEIDGAEAHRDLEAGSLGADAGHDLAQEPGAVLEAAAVLAGPIDGAQELVAQIAVAMLDVDEVEARTLGEPGRPARSRR